jgi:hypothetical protein
LSDRWEIHHHQWQYHCRRDLFPKPAGGVQIDEGNNGTIDDPFAICNGAEGICTETEV